MSKAKVADWRKVTPAPVLLVFGPEEYLVSRVLRSIREQLRLGNPDLEITDIEAADYSGGQLQDLSGPSLFASPRLVIIRGLDRCSDELIEDGISYLDSLGDETTLVLIHNGSSVRGKKLLDALRGNPNVTEVPCAKLTKDSERAAFITAEFASEGRQITSGAIKALQEAFEKDLAELAAACAQLMQDSSSTISEELVDSYYGGRVETSVFKVADAAIAGQSAKALGLLRHLLASGADPVQIVAGLATTMRRYAKAFGNRSVTSGDLGVQPWVLEQIRRNLNGWTDEGMARTVIAMADADAAAKGEKRDPIYNLEQLIILISKKGAL